MLELKNVTLQLKTVKKKVIKSPRKCAWKETIVKYQNVFCNFFKNKQKIKI